MVVGYFGLYNDEAEQFLLKIIKKYIFNKIIILPSSFYIDKIENLTNLLSIINNHQNIHIFARDYISYLNFKKYFIINSIYECSDMVFYLKNYFNIDKSNSKILIISRNDNEMIYSDLKKLKIGEQLSNIINIPIKFTFNEYQKILMNYLTKLASAEYIITDTLHITIFSYLLNINCYALNNKYGKVKNTILEYMQNSSIKYIGKIDDTIKSSNIEFSKLIKIINE